MRWLHDASHATQCQMRSSIGILSILPSTLLDRTKRTIAKNREVYASRHDYTSCLSSWQLNSHEFGGWYSRYWLIYMLLNHNPFGFNLNVVMWLDWDAIFVNHAISIQSFLQNTSFVLSATPVNFMFGVSPGTNINVFDCLLKNKCCIPQPYERNEYWSRYMIDHYVKQKDFPPVNNGVFIVEKNHESNRVLEQMMSLKINSSCDGCIFIQLVQRVSVAFYSEASFSTFWTLNDPNPFVRHWGGTGKNRQEFIDQWKNVPDSTLVDKITRTMDPITKSFTLKHIQSFHKNGNIENGIRYCSKEYAVREFERHDFIPKVIYQTYFKQPPQRIINELHAHSAGFNYRFFDNEEASEFLTTHFLPEVVARFWKLGGAHRADLFRYCILYVYGGYYFDVKTKFRRNIAMVFNKDAKWYSTLSIVPNTIYQGILATPPMNPILRKAIAYCVEADIEHVQKNYQLFTAKLYEYIVESYSPHQSLSAGRYVNNEWSLYLFKEKCVTNSLLKDRYGLDCSIMDHKKRRVFTTRHYDFPWKD